MYKKTLLSLAVASSVALTGCLDKGSSDKNANPDYKISSNQFEGKTYPVFDPVNGDLPLPNDLIFQSDDLDTVGVSEADGTFDVPDSKPPVTTAINKLSGASTVAPIDIAMNGEIDASSVDGEPFRLNADGSLVLKDNAPVPNPNQNVFLLELDYASGNALQALSIGEPPTVPAATPFVTLATLKAQLTDDDTSNDAAAQAALPGALAAAQEAARAARDQYKVSVVEQSGKSVIRINLLKPLNPEKRYIVAVTKSVKDTSGEPIVSSPTYANLTETGAPLGTSSLAPVKTLINSLWEAVAANYFAIPNSSREAAGMADLTADDIAVSYSFTTSGDEKILTYMSEPSQWFTGQLQSLVKLTAVRKVAGAASVLSQVAKGSSLADALESKRKSVDEVGPNDLNHNGEIDALDFDFNGDSELTTADFDLVDTGDTASSTFNYYDVQQAISLAEQGFPSAGLKQALPNLFGTGAPCEGDNFDSGTACAGAALASSFSAALPNIGDHSDSVSLPTYNDSSVKPSVLLTPAVSSVTGSSTALVLQGSIELPYYLGVPTGSDGSTINSSTWTANHTLAESLNTNFSGIGLQIPQGAKSPTTGDYVSEAVNYLYPFPAKTADQKVPMLVMVPYPGKTTDLGVQWNGTDKLPVVVFQHGITTDRSAALSVGSVLTAAGYAVVAIDLPLHGVDAEDQSDKTSGKTQEQQALAQTLLDGFNDEVQAAANQASIDVPNQATSENVAILVDPDENYTSNVIQLLATYFGCTSQDPQAILGGVCGEIGKKAVAFAIGAENAVANYTSVIPGIERTTYERHFNFTANASGTPVPMDFDTGVGSSGSLYINLQNFINSRDKNLQSQIDLVNVIESLGDIDINGDSVGDFDTTQVFLAGHSLGTVAGSGAVAVANQTGVTDVVGTALLAPASGITRMLENSPSFGPRILAGLQASGLEQGSQNYETFMRIVQTAIDPADPINLADNIVDGGKGIITFNIVGTEDANGNTKFKSDQTNVIEAAKTQFRQAFPDYLAGAIPLSEELGATNVTDAAAAGKLSLASNLAYGAHGMYVLPSPDSDIEDETERAADFQRQQSAFGESMLQLVEFVMANGTLATSVDPTDGRLGDDGKTSNDPSTTPILDERPVPTAQDVKDDDDTDEFKQLN
ncbi:hypothetical protein QQM79_19210 [Marinobacteraceae bacterium S3BR75-40.1]